MERRRSDVHPLHEFVTAHREEIIGRCRKKASSRSTPVTQAEIDHGVPLFMEQLIDALRRGVASNAKIGETALLHGRDLLRQGFTASQVVHNYGDVCQAVTELAGELHAPIAVEDFRMLNQCLDEGIAGAVTAYGRERMEPGIEGESVDGSERLGFLAHELRNLTNTAIVAFEVLKTGNVGLAGSTGGVLHRSLMAIRALVSRSLAEVRLTEGIQNRERLLVSVFIDEITQAATWAADAAHVMFNVIPSEDRLEIEADRQVLSAAVMNLLQNAFKFTHARSTVTLRVGASSERVLIEVQDACGGLPGGAGADLFHPFEQRGADRTGLGLGLAFSRWAVEANHGRIYARNLPGVGCIFTVDLPRLAMPALATG